MLKSQFHGYSASQHVIGLSPVCVCVCVCVCVKASTCLPQTAFSSSCPVSLLNMFPSFLLLSSCLRICHKILHSAGSSYPGLSPFPSLSSSLFFFSPRQPLQIMAVLFQVLADSAYCIYISDRSHILPPPPPRGQHPHLCVGVNGCPLRHSQ